MELRQVKDLLATVEVRGQERDFHFTLILPITTSK